MKKSTKIALVVVAAILGIVIFLAVRFFPTVQVGSEIAKLLEPVLEAQNQSMDLDFSIEASGQTLELDSKVYLVEQLNVKYLALEQNGYPLYVAEGMLILENGKAFRLTENDTSKESLGSSLANKNLFLQIAAIYEVVEITCTESEDYVTYACSVTGEQAQSLLSSVSPSKDMDLSAIKDVSLQIVAKNEVLEKVKLTGDALLEDKEVSVEVVISDFQMLQEGEYKIPAKIANTVAIVEKESLFSITGDLFRLLQAFRVFSEQEKPSGTVELYANCGIIQFDSKYDLEKLQSGTVSLNNAAEIEELPEMVALLCLEGDIRCTKEGDAYLYELVLNEDSMQQISQMIVPQLVEQAIALTKGTVEIRLEEEQVSVMDIRIDGSIKVLFTKVDANIGAKFHFTME